MGGHIEEIRKGYYKVVVEAGRDPETGKRKRIVKYVKGRKNEAEELLAELIVETKKGMYTVPNKITVEEWINRWLETYKKIEVSVTTWAKYYATFNSYIKPALGTIQLQQLRSEHIQQLYQKLVDYGYSYSTVYMVHVVLNGALKQALKNKLIYFNPMEGVTLPKKPKHRAKVLTFEEQQKFMKVLKGERLGPAFLVLLFTGIRRGELLALTWQDIDFDKKIITVNKSVVVVSNTGKIELIIKSTKTGDIRFIPMSDTVFKALKEHQERMILEGNYGIDKPVFCTRNGNYIYPANLNTKYKELLKLAGITENYNLHVLRHTFATRLLESGVSIKIVQKLLGHVRMSTTADIYSHVLFEVQKDAIQKLEEYIWHQNGTK